MSEATVATAPLSRELNQAIASLLMEGRRVNEVIAHGLARRPGWRQKHVIDLVEARGWTLDSDGRIPRRLRTTQIPPATPLPGGPIPEPPRRPVVEYPPEGTVTEGRGANAAASLIATGKRHDVATIRRLAEKAGKALQELQDAIKADEANAVVRNRLAQIEAEAEQLRAQLRGPGRPRKAKAPGGKPPASKSTKEINHGTWGGYLAHRKRHHPESEIDAECMAAKADQMDKLRGKRTHA